MLALEIVASLYYPDGFMYTFGYQVTPTLGLAVISQKMIVTKLNYDRIVVHRQAMPVTKARIMYKALKAKGYKAP